jgi:choline dehydrogenase-like flavoprotein
VFMDVLEVADDQALSADLCVVGAGAAGISLALQFVGTPTAVLLLESGPLNNQGEGEGIYRIQPGLVPRLTRDTEKSGQFGGNTNFWLGNCRPLDTIDFERHDWIPHSGWPITRDHLTPFYERAEGICGLGDYRCYDLDVIRPHLTNQPMRVDPAMLVTRVVHTCPVPSFRDLYRDTLRDAGNVRVCVNARATQLETDPSGGRVIAVRAVAANGRRLRVAARSFVLAAGGVENARLLLCSNEVRPDGLGNDRDLVGRYFMEHVWVDIPLGRSVGGHDVRFYHGRQHVGTTTVWGQLALSEACLRLQRVAGLCFWFQSNQPVVSTVGALAGRVLGKVLGRPRRVAPDDGYALRVQVEQTPNPRNRVRLGGEPDPFGQPRATLELRFDVSELRNAARSLQIATTAVGLDGGRLAGQFRQLLEAGRGDYFWHHMGTTRMHSDPAQGVVDADCRVHDVANLFVAGSSVFPTGGTAPPTLTIVALALRLAQHLRRVHP